MDPKGHAAVVTGAASGLGAETATTLARAGAKVALLDVNIDGAREVAGRIGGVAIRCDVTSADDAAKALAEATAKHGTARILVNCAGVGPAKRIVGRDGPMPLAEFEKVIAINLVGTFLVLSVAAEAMADTERLLSRRTDLRQVVYPTFGSPEFVDWFDYEERNAAGDPEAFARRALEAAGGNAIWVIWSPNYRTFEGQCERLLNGISAVRGLSTDRVVADQNIYEFMGLREFPAP